jgi:hypothetical protein
VVVPECELFVLIVAVPVPLLVIEASPVIAKPPALPTV